MRFSFQHFGWVRVLASDGIESKCVLHISPNLKRRAFIISKTIFVFRFDPLRHHVCMYVGFKAKQHIIQVHVSHINNRIPLDWNGNLDLIVRISDEWTKKSARDKRDQVKWIKKKRRWNASRMSWSRNTPQKPFLTVICVKLEAEYVRFLCAHFTIKLLS